MRRYISLLLFIGLAWGQACTADDGTDGVELWSECYSIENTNSLDLSGSWDNPGPGELTGSIPPEIGNLTNLTYLDLENNQLTGSIPSEIGNLTNLTYLDLGENQLTGEIPTELYNLTNLERLRVDNNQLFGEIPSEIGNLTNLNDLSLYGNQFTGSIDNICYMSSLTYISISKSVKLTRFPILSGISPVS